MTDAKFRNTIRSYLSTDVDHLRLKETYKLISELVWDGILDGQEMEEISTLLMAAKTKIEKKYMDELLAEIQAGGHDEY